MKQIRKLSVKWRGISLAGFCATLLVLGMRYLGLLQGWEWAAYDHYLRWRSASNTRPEDRIKIITIDETDLQTGGQALISDAALAQAIQILSSQDPLVIGLDLYRDLPVPPGYDELAIALKETSNIVGIQKVGYPSVAPPPILAEVNRAKANDFMLDGDNQVRRAFFFLNNARGDSITGFGAYIALWFLDEIENLQLEELADDRWSIGKAKIKPFGAFDGGYNRADTRGYQFLINYHPLGSESFPKVAFKEVIAGNLPPNWATGKIILIGATAESLKDVFPTPLSRSRSTDTPKLLPGVEINAHIIAQFLDAATGERPFIRIVPESLEITWLFLWSIIGAYSTWSWSTGRKRVRAQGKFAQINFFVRYFIGPLVFLSITIACSYIAFEFSIWLPVIPPIVGFMTASGGLLIYFAYRATQLLIKNAELTIEQLKSDRLLFNTLPQSIAIRLKQGETDVANWFPEATVLFADIVGFTPLSEKIPPREMLAYLNEIFSALDTLTEQYQLEKIRTIGDNYMVAAGVPEPREDHAEAIANMALGIPEAIQKFNLRNGTQINMRIGINTGPLIGGVVGSKKMLYDIWGDSVNTASRMESHGVPGQIQVTPATYNKLKDLYIFEPRGVIPVKGKGEMATYFLVGKRE
ncbi:MAG: CHASE2 domain-containing protein [Spirulina sp. SIO3F2]|nr:CHASE2 domain-containing protein [Spirulina sp. SIO3F2]